VTTESAWTWTVALAPADTSSRGVKRPFSKVYNGSCLLDGRAAGGAGSRAPHLLLAVGAILCARFRAAFAEVGPDHHTPLAPVHVHARTGAKLLLLACFKRFDLFFG